MLKCNVCECEFTPTIVNHYIARDNDVCGFSAGFGTHTEPILYDAYDCPQCGSQLICQDRKRKYISNKNDKKENQ